MNPKQLENKIERVLESDGKSFSELVKVAGLDPARSFRFLSLRGLDLRGQSFHGYDFTGADLRGSLFSPGALAGANLDGALVDNYDREEALLQAMAAGPTPSPRASLHGLVDLKAAIEAGENNEMRVLARGSFNSIEDLPAGLMFVAGVRRANLTIASSSLHLLQNSKMNMAIESMMVESGATSTRAWSNHHIVPKDIVALPWSDFMVVDGQHRRVHSDFFPNDWMRSPQAQVVGLGEIQFEYRSWDACLKGELWPAHGVPLCKFVRPANRAAGSAEVRVTVTCRVRDLAVDISGKQVRGGAKKLVLRQYLRRKFFGEHIAHDPDDEIVLGAVRLEV